MAAKKQPEIFEGTAAIGMDVLWYKGANPHASPIPAKVHLAYEGGVCNLVVFHRSGQEHYPSVWHMSNPGLRHQDTGKRTQNAEKNGAWDFTPWARDEYDYRLQLQAKASKAKSEPEEK